MFSDPAWGSGLPLLLQRYSRVYGDVDFAAELYDNAMSYLLHLNAYAKPWPLPSGTSTPLLQAISYPGSRYGDWCAVGDDCTHVSNLQNSFYHISTVDALYDLAVLLNQTADIKELSANRTAMCQAFQAAYYNATIGAYDDPLRPAKSPGTGQDNSPFSVQTAQSIALKLRCGTDDELQRAADYLANDVQSRNNSLSTGVTGCKYLLRALSDFGYGDLALALAADDRMPSLGYMALQSGSVWEQWGVDGTWNHIMFGGLLAWQHEVGWRDWARNAETVCWTTLRLSGPPSARHTPR